MGIEYFQEKWQSPSRSGPSDTAFHYRAFGPADEEGNVPYAEVGGYHRKTQYAPTFDSSDSSRGGRSRAFLSHKYDTLMKKSWDNPLDEEEKSAIDAARHFLVRNPDHGPEEAAKAQHQLDNNPHLAADKLFEETSPARIHISGMFADPSMKSSALTLVGMAYEQHNRDPLEASADLSHYSSRLVQKAMDKGLPVQGHNDNVSAKQTNDIQLAPRFTSTHWVQENYSQRPGVTKSTPEQVTRGRGVVREMLGRTKTRNTTPVTNALSDQFLPGMEKYA